MVRIPRRTPPTLPRSGGFSIASVVKKARPHPGHRLCCRNRSGKQSRGSNSTSWRESRREVAAFENYGTSKASPSTPTSMSPDSRPGGTGSSPPTQPTGLDGARAALLGRTLPEFIARRASSRRYETRARLAIALRVAPRQEASPLPVTWRRSSYASPVIGVITAAAHPVLVSAPVGSGHDQRFRNTRYRLGCVS